MNVLDELIDRLAGGATRDYLGEPVSQLDHALQSAHFARAAGASDALVVAALLHDVGHVYDDAGVEPATELGLVRHDSIGAAYLRAIGFDEEIAALVDGHVRAKRYLVARRRGYVDRLSDASRRTLALQVGPMTGDEAAAFEEEPRFASLLRLRRWDERGKVAGLRVAPLEVYRALLAAQVGAVRCPLVTKGRRLLSVRAKTAAGRRMP